jgi:flagellar biosynthetic protein FliP
MDVTFQPAAVSTQSGEPRHAKRNGDQRRRAIKRGWTLSLVVLVALGVWLLPAVAEALPKVDISIGGGSSGREQVGGAIKLIALMTVLSLAPAILMLMTCFTRLVIVLNFSRQALGVQGMPPNQIMMGLALILTIFVMAPVGRQAYNQGVEPYMKGQLDETQAIDATLKPVRKFMLHHTRVKDLQLFLDISNTPAPATAEQIPTSVLVPAFVISELTTAFHMGFLIYLPFLMLDFVVASILMSMGMVMLPPALVSLPLKVMLFVLVDGWHLIIGSVVRSVTG